MVVDMRSRWWGLLLVTICWAAGPARAAGPASPAAFCRTVRTDDRLRPIPDSLVPAATRLFQLAAMPPGQVRRSTYFRCAAHHVLLCTVGANLPCGKANTQRHLPAADAWCAAHPGSDFVPMYVTGHDTIYTWLCRGTAATIVRRRFKVDRRGFIAEFWKRADADP